MGYPPIKTTMTKGYDILFNSYIFFVFALLFFLGWTVANRRNSSRWLYLSLASLFFYGWWDWRFIFLIIFSGIIDYYAALAIEKYPLYKRSFLILSLFGNIGSLALFKYSAFIAENIEGLLATLGVVFELQSRLPYSFLMLPVGISFYTFQSMSYTLDVYRGVLKPTGNVLHFFAYLSMFPQLLAGPIVRAKDILAQLAERRYVADSDRWDGTRLILGGYFKKVVIADNLGSAVNYAFSSPQISQSSLYWWAIITAFAFQIYCDFSGYSDIAIGLARWMGYRFKLNFNHPYIACSIRDFWGRWHISLSTWFRDYVYFPLGGSRKGHLRGHLNMWITMVLSGLWHGASWTFVIWGAIHALYLSIERLTRWPERIFTSKAGVLLCQLIVLVQVWVAWVFFRANDFSQALSILKVMFSFNNIMDPSLGFEAMTALVAIAVWEFTHRVRGNLLSQRNFRAPPMIQVAVYSAVACCCVFLRGPRTDFIYFQF